MEGGHARRKLLMSEQLGRRDGGVQRQSLLAWHIPSDPLPPTGPCNLKFPLLPDNATSWQRSLSDLRGPSRYKLESYILGTMN